MKTSRNITVTLRMDDKHDVRAVRRLLKRLLRAYDLLCVGLSDGTNNCTEEKASGGNGTDDTGPAASVEAAGKRRKNEP